VRDGKRSALAAAALATLCLACVVVVRENGFLLVVSSGAGAAPRPVSATSRVAVAVGEPRAPSRLGATRQLPAARGAGSDAAPLASRLTQAPAPPSPPADARPRDPQRDAASSDDRIWLEALEIPPDAVTASVSGFDAGAPRALALWRIDGGRFERIGAATSDADARIRAPQLALPEAGLALVVTPMGVRPGEPGASTPLQLARASDPPRPELPASVAPRWRAATSTLPPATEEDR